MRVPLTFRTIWKIDALIILIGGVGVCLMTGYAGFEFLQSRFRPYQKEGVVTVEGHAEERWGLGNFLTIPGAGCMVAPLNSVQSYSRSLNEKDLSAVRNYLFLNVQDKSTRWLTPKHDRLILSMEWMAADGSSENKWGTDKKPVKWLIFQVVPSDTDGDGRLTENDRKAIAVANPDGSQYAEVVRDADELLGTTWMAGDKLLLIYTAGGKSLVSEIDLPGRKVSVTKELPKIDP